jgi:hypothetical protein
MGGSGSTRWGFESTAQTVDSALGMPTTHLREGLNRIADGTASASWGALQWSRRGSVFSTIGYRLTPRASGHRGIVQVRLQYTTTRYNGEKIESDYTVLAIATVPHFGGRRWWWLCPLTKHDRPCMRRVGKLYLPSGASYFGCRHCYGLTYTSCQESHKYDSMFRQMGVDPKVAQRLFSRRGYR